MIIKCLMCGKEIETTNAKRKYCDRNCKERHRIERSKVPTNCAYCGKEFMASTIRGTRFCSQSCTVKYVHEHESEKLTKILKCVDCGVEFEFTGRTTKKRCDACKKKFKSERAMICRAAKDPNVHLGVGSGGSQTPKQIGFATDQLFQFEDDTRELQLARRREQYRENREFLELSPTGKVNYRKLMLTGSDSCDICGYNTLQEALEVHHKDFDRSHNVKDNLAVLCSNCHTTLHKIVKSNYMRHGTCTGDYTVYESVKLDILQKINQHNN